MNTAAVSALTDPKFYQHYCTNGRAYLEEEPDNAKYSQIEPVTFRTFIQSHKREKLATIS
jgi:hypothetical protein